MDDDEKEEIEILETGNPAGSCPNASSNGDNSQELSLFAPKNLYPSAQELPPHPPSAIRQNFTHFFAIDFLKERHDQYIYRHANGLCVIGLAPTHIAFESGSLVTAVDFNVGKQSRADMKATGKRKNNARTLEPNSALCKVVVEDAIYVIRCCVKGALLEVNERLIREPALLNSHAATEGYVAIMMPKADDWKKSQKALLTRKEYRDCRSLDPEL